MQALTLDDIYVDSLFLLDMLQADQSNPYDLEAGARLGGFNLFLISDEG